MQKILRLALVAILTALVAVGCAPTIKTPPPPPRPAATAPVAPMVERAQAAAAVQSETSAKLETKVETLRQTTADLRRGVVAATAEADRLRTQKSATEAELNSLWGMLTHENTRVADLAKQAEESQALAETHRAQRIEAEKRLREATAAANQLEMETLFLRQQHDAMATTITTAQANEATIQARLTKAEKKAAVGTYLKGIVWLLGITAFLAFALWLATKWRII